MTEKTFVSIKIAREVYESLKKAKDEVIEDAEKSGNTKLVDAFRAMGLGSFASWLIVKQVDKIKAEARK